MIVTFLALAGSLTLAFCAGVEFACVRRRELDRQRRRGYLDLTGIRELSRGES